MYVGSRFEGTGCQELSGEGKVLAPGFIDIHTHFDPQLCWDGAARPCLEHGVTTVVTGNCSLSLAPVRDRKAADKIVSMFNVIEDIKVATFDAAVPFAWEHFGEWLDFIRPKLSVNVAPLVGHSAVRLYVMGEDSQQRAATDEEIDAMCRIIEGAMEAGAVGVSSSYVDVDERARPVPSRYADLREKTKLAQAMARAGRGRHGHGPGVWEVVHSFNDRGGLKGDMDEHSSLRELGQISIESGAAVSYQPVILDKRKLQQTVSLLEDVRGRGGRLRGQIQVGDFVNHLRLSETNEWFMQVKHWGRNMWGRSKEDRLKAFADPREQDLLIKALEKDPKKKWFQSWWVSQVSHLDNQRYLRRRLGEIAAEEGKELGRVILEISLRDDLEAAFAFMAPKPLSTIADLVESSSSVFEFGASDAGAHVTQKCGTGETTDVLVNFVRGGAMALEKAVHELTGKAAELWGIADRGTLRVGNAADLVLFDLDQVKNCDLEYVNDVPGGQSRYFRHAQGFEAVLVNGTLVLVKDKYTGAKGCGSLV